MTDKTTNTDEHTTHLFENNFAYVTREGEVKLKENKFFEERTLVKTDPETVDEQIKSFENAYKDLESAFDAFFDEISEDSEIVPQQIRDKADELIDKAKSADAIGDFESLISTVNKKVDSLLSVHNSDKNSKNTETDDNVTSPEKKKSAEKTRKNSSETKKNAGKDAETDFKDDPAVSKKSEDKEAKIVEDQNEVKPEDDEFIAEEISHESTETEETPIAEEPTAEAAETGETTEEAVAEKPSEEEKKEVKAEETKEETEEEPVAEAKEEKAEAPEAEVEEPADEKTEVATEEVKEKAETEEKAPITEVDEETAPELYYKKLAEKAETFLKLSDWSYATMEFENLDIKWEEGPDPDGADIKPYRNKIDDLREQLEEKKKAHYEEQKRIKEQNLEKKKELLKQLGQIIEEEKWTLTREVSKIQNRWEQVKPIPAGEQEKLDASFKELITTFEDHKVDRLVKQKQQEEDNLTIKLVVLEKMEQFTKNLDETSDWIELDKKLAEYSRQFRKIGRIPAEKNQETWDRFHNAQDEFHSKRFEFDKKYRKNIEKYLSKKKKLIDEAEALIDAEDLPKAARKVNKLHRQWKKIGNLPQKDENELWDRFKAATDAFNEKKSENIDELRNQEEENYEKKLELIKKADELKESEEWEETHKEFQRLMDNWKAIGPVPRKKSGKIWKKFKGAMDVFYDRRREFFKEVKDERKDNLKEKEQILDQLRELKTYDNPIEAVEKAKPLQADFKKAGYVPIKHKNRMWKEYREICDVIYERFRAAKSAAQIVGKENVEHFSTDDLTQIKKKQDQADKLRKEISRLSSELIQMKESLSYFKPSGKGGSSLLDDARDRIDKTEKGLNKKEEKLQTLEVEIDKIKRNS